MNSKKITFDPLPNTVPAGTQVGGEFDLVCTFKLEDGGKVCLTQMGDVKAPEYKEDKSMVRPGMDDEIQAMQDSMKPGDNSEGGGY